MHTCFCICAISKQNTAFVMTRLKDYGDETYLERAKRTVLEQGFIQRNLNTENCPIKKAALGGFQRWIKQDLFASYRAILTGVFLNTNIREHQIQLVVGD